eukprot:915138-Pleurochrysis_carterae.AAC.1
MWQARVRAVPPACDPDTSCGACSRPADAALRSVSAVAVAQPLLCACGKRHAELLSGGWQPLNAAFNEMQISRNSAFSF